MRGFIPHIEGVVPPGLGLYLSVHPGLRPGLSPFVPPVLASQLLIGFAVAFRLRGFAACVLAGSLEA